jgi:hypothetical protein
LKLALLAGAALLVVTRRAVRRSREVRIAEAAAPAFRREPALSVFRQVAVKLARLAVEDLRAEGDAHDHVLALAPVAVGAFAVTTALCLMLGVKTEVEECVERRVGFEPDVAAAPAVAARGAAARDEFFASEGRHAVPAVAAPNPYLDPINKQNDEL